MDLIYTDSVELNEQSWERVIHSLITSCDSMWINENVTFSRTIPEWLRKHFINIFNELIEEGIIKIWNYERNLINSQSSIVVEENETRILYEAINHQITSFNNYGTISGKEIRGDEITSKIIQYKHELWNIGIANILDIDGICYPTGSSTPKYSTNYYKYELIDRKYSEILFKKFEVYPVSLLSTEDIKSIRKKSDILIKQLSKYTKNKITEIPPSGELIENECQTLFDSCQKELNALIKEKSLKKFGVDLSKEAVIATVGTIFPIISLVPFGEKIINLFRDKRKYSFLFFALDIKSRAYNSYVNLYNKHNEIVKYFA